MSQINVAPQDLQLSVQQALPAAGANVTSGILDLQAIAPNSNAWRLGRIAVLFPALPENTAGAGITVSLQAAPPSLVSGVVAPNTAPPGAFVTPVCSQTITITPVALAGSPATLAYFTLAFDSTGSTYQFYQFLITTPAGVVTLGEIVNIGWING